MTMTRREFAGTSLAAAGAAGLPALGAAAYPGDPGVLTDSKGAAAGGAARAGRLLILGGTGFIGPHMVRHALARGHEVTLFNRGRSNPGLFPGVETLIGLEIEDDRAFIAIDGGEVLAVTVVDRRPHAHRVAGRALHLDDLRAHVREQHRAEGAGRDLAELDDLDSLK